MKRILTAIVLIALVFGLVFWGNQLALIVVSALVALLAAYEYVALTRSGDEVVPAWWLLPAVAVLFAVTYWRPLDSPLPVLSALGLSLLTIVAFREAKSGHLDRVLPIAAAGFFGLIYIAYPLTLLPQIIARENGPTLLIFLMLVVWTGDIAALYIGKAFGKRKLAPRTEPEQDAGRRARLHRWLSPDSRCAGWRLRAGWPSRQHGPAHHRAALADPAAGGARQCRRTGGRPA